LCIKIQSYNPKQKLKLVKFKYDAKFQQKFRETTLNQQTQ